MSEMFIVGRTLPLEDYKRMSENMVRLQASLNEEICGPNWVVGFTDNQKQIDWELCIKKEISEVIDSYPWKHWKDINGEIDYKNIQIEMVDILHFIISEILRLVTLGIRSGDENLLKTLETTDPITEAVKLIMPTHYLSTVNEFVDSIRAASESHNISLPNVIFNMFKTWFIDKYDVEENYIMFLTILQTLTEFNGFGFEDVYKIYIGKNALNAFRKNNGYKDGTYRKMWNLDDTEVEDNVVLQYILDNSDEVLSYEVVLIELEKFYNE